MDRNQNAKSRGRQLEVGLTRQSGKPPQRRRKIHLCKEKGLAAVGEHSRIVKPKGCKRPFCTKFCAPRGVRKENGR